MIIPTKRDVELITVELNRKEINKLLKGNNLVYNVNNEDCDDTSITLFIYCSEPNEEM